MQIGPFASATLSRLAAALAVGFASFGTLAPVATAQSGEMKPMAVIAATSYDQLLSDIDYLGKFGGQVKAGQQLNNMLLMFTQNKGLQGLDKAKSWARLSRRTAFNSCPSSACP